MNSGFRGTVDTDAIAGTRAEAKIHTAWFVTLVGEQAPWESAAPLPLCDSSPWPSINAGARAPPSFDAFDPHWDYPYPNSPRAMGNPSASREA